MEQIEKQVLSASMLTYENYALAIERGVTGAWFCECGPVFDALADYGEWNERDSMVVLSPVVEKFKCHDLIEDVPEWAFNIEEFESAVDVLSGVYAKRTLLNSISRATHSLSEGEDPAEVAGRLIASAEAMNESIKNGDISTAEIVDSALERDKLVADGGRVGLPFPWHSFQRRTFGIPNRAVTPLAGRDGKGKSRLTTYLASWWVSSGTPILYMPFEDGKERFISNVAASVGGYDMFTIKREYVPPDFMPMHEGFMQKVKGMPIYVEDMPCTAEKITSIIAKHKRKYGIEGVVIDGLKDVVPSGGDGEVGRENHINSVLVRAAIKYDVAIITVSHLTDIEDDKWISKRNIRGSKRQSQSARMVLMYQDRVLPKIESRFCMLDGDIVLECQKNSYGEGGIIPLRPEFFRGRFEEITENV